LDWLRIHHVCRHGKVVAASYYTAATSWRCALGIDSPVI
jgi:hypothetical protein